MWKLGILLWTVIQSATSLNEYDEYTPKAAQKIPLILMHKQALSNNGDFNFAFASDNGLKHGEKIHPDGSRTGAYSYVDPNGKTISVKYSAGKDGFRILEGDHVPKAIQIQSAIPAHPHNYHSSAEEYNHHHNRASAPFVARAPSGGGGFPFASSSNLESGEQPFYSRASPLTHQASFRSQHQPLVSGAAGGSRIASTGAGAGTPTPYKIFEDSSQEILAPSVNLREQQHHSSEDEDSHKGPHSFGSGYAFEFSAAAKNNHVDYNK